MEMEHQQVNSHYGDEIVYTVTGPSYSLYWRRRQLVAQHRFGTSVKNLQHIGLADVSNALERRCVAMPASQQAAATAAAATTTTICLNTVLDRSPSLAGWFLYAGQRRRRKCDNKVLVALCAPLGLHRAATL